MVVVGYNYFMKNNRLALSLLLSTVWLGLAGPSGLAAQLVPLGPETDLLADTFPRSPFLAAQPDGAYLVAWDEGYDSHEGIYYRYIAAGETPEELGPSTIGFEDRYPSVDAVTAAAKGFDVLWHEPASGKPTAFYRQHLTLRGVPDGNSIRLGGPGTEWVWHVRGNGFVAGWTLPRKHAIAAQRLGSKGERVGPELRLNSRPIDAPRPVVMAVADGGFVAVWLGLVPGPTAKAVLRARRFSPAGKPLGPDFDVNSIPLDLPGTPPYVDPDFKVAAAPGGRFAVSWVLKGKIYLRFFSAAGTALGPEVPAVALPDADFDGPESMAFDNSGNLLMLWRYSGDNIDLRLQLFNPRGAALGPPVAVRSEASDIFDAPWGGRVVWTGSSWLVAWGAAGAASYDFSTIFVRRFGRKQ
jgi:hypothetical protein